MSQTHQNISATTKNILRALESRKTVIVTHPISGSITIDDAKPLGFGTASTMVRFAQSHGWTTVDPLTWSII